MGLALLIWTYICEIWKRIRYEQFIFQLKLAFNAANWIKGYYRLQLNQLDSRLRVHVFQLQIIEQRRIRVLSNRKAWQLIIKTSN